MLKGDKLLGQPLFIYLSDQASIVRISQDGLNKPLHTPPIFPLPPHPVGGFPLPTLYTIEHTC
jgi:hypothetical protein